MKENRYYFRGKTLDHKEWLYGALTLEKDENGHLGYFIFQRGVSHHEIINNINDYEVDKCSICQSTGYKGFEHDMFKCDNGVYEIVWSSKYLEWYAKAIGGDAEDWRLSAFKQYEIDIIGNVFDNGELYSKYISDRNMTIYNASKDRRSNNEKNDLRG